MSTHTHAPHAAKVWPISPKQADLIGRLRAERGIEHDADAIALLTSKEASALIDTLFATPKPKGAQAEPGYYLGAKGEVVRVVLNKAGTNTYATVLTAHEGTRPTWEYAPGVSKALAGLTPLTAEEAGKAGLAFGHCIKCCAPLGGESVAAKVSAVIGYGATCAANQGWPFPAGVKSQRAFLLLHGVVA